MNDFHTADALCLSVFGAPLMSFSFREAINIYYGFLIKDQSREDREKLDAALRGERSSDGRMMATDQQLEELADFEKQFIRPQGNE